MHEICVFKIYDTYTIDLVFKISKSDPSQSLIHLIPNYCKCRKTKKKIMSCAVTPM